MECSRPGSEGDLLSLWLIFVSYREWIVLSQVSSQGTCLGLGSANGSCSLQMPEFLGRNGSSGCPECLTLGREGAKGF